MRRLFAVSVCFYALVGACAAHAQEAEGLVAVSRSGVTLTLGAEVRGGFRWSEDDRFPLSASFPPDFVPVGEPNVALQTVSPGSSLEFNKISLLADMRLPHQIGARLRIDFVDLYDRNPTSTDKVVDVDEAWLSFGRRRPSLEPLPGTSFYALFGKAHKFERQAVRRTESYGLVSTAFNRLPDLQLQVGGSFGRSLYFFGQISDGNPVFMRDPNALAGDNGTAPPPNPDPWLHSGFPILYDAEVEDLQIDGNFEYGIGGGFRVVSEDLERGLDLLGFYYQTKLSKKARLRGTFYEGDLDILDAGALGLPVTGDERKEYGANLDLRWRGLNLFVQAVKQDLAGLPRFGFESELAYRLALGDLADPEDLFPSLEPIVRYSKLTNDFAAPKGFTAPSLAWDWAKLDLALRLGILKAVDLTVEYSIHDIEASREIAHDEFLGTLRLRF